MSLTPQQVDQLYDWSLRRKAAAMAKGKKNPGSDATAKVADKLDHTYHQVIGKLQNASPYDEQVKGAVKQLMNEFADYKSDTYENE